MLKATASCGHIHGCADVSDPAVPCVCVKVVAEKKKQIRHGPIHVAIATCRQTPTPTRRRGFAW